MIKVDIDSDEVFEKLYQHGISSGFSSFNITIINQMIDYFVIKEKYEYCKILKDVLDEREKPTKKRDSKQICKNSPTGSGS